jgi:hypothetical protein
MLSELSNSIKASLYERAISPLSGVFFISWVVINWRLLSVLFLSNQDIVSRISFIDSSYVNSYPNFWEPIWISVVIAVCYPFIGIIPYFLWEKANAIKLTIKAKLEIDTPLTVEQQKQMRQQLEKLTRKQYEYDALMTSILEKLTESAKVIDNAQESKNDSQVTTNYDQELSQARANIQALQSDIKKIISNEKTRPVEDPQKSEWSGEFKRLSTRKEFADNMRILRAYVPSSLHNLPNPAEGYLYSIGVVQPMKNKDGNVIGIEVTDKGRYFLKRISMEN